MINSNLKGAISEGMVDAYLKSKGYYIFAPTYNSGGRVDLIALNEEKKKHFYIGVKTAWIKSEKQIKCPVKEGSPGTVSHTKWRESGPCYDVLAVVKGDEIAFLKREEIIKDDGTPLQTLTFNTVKGKRVWGNYTDPRWM